MRKTMSKPAARCFGWSGPCGEEFAPDKSVSATTGRASHGYHERYLSKECVGSNRALTRTIATSRRDNDRDESPMQTHRQRPSSGSTTARAALPYVSPSPYALRGWAKSVRRRRDDSRARARWCSVNRHPHNQPEHENRRLRRALPLCNETDGNRFRLTNSYRKGHIARTAS